MEYIAAHLVGPADVTRAAVFDDQYISTGGQFYEMIAGHDRFIADLRPAFYQMQGQPGGPVLPPVRLRDAADRGRGRGDDHRRPRPAARRPPGHDDRPKLDRVRQPGLAAADRAARSGSSWPPADGSERPSGRRLGVICDGVAMAAVLVVDDHAGNRLPMVRLLQLDGYDAAGASNAFEALAAVNHSPSRT